jgi:EmrB/QacA subfamily drug resistance transporter
MTAGASPDRNLVVAIICLGSFLSPMSMASFTVAIPAMAAELRADAVSVSLLPTVFLLSSVALMLPCAKLADNLGRKRVYTLGIALNACASLAAFAAPDVEWILLLRFIQGAGSAMIFSTSLAIITAVFPASERGLPMGLNTAAVYLGLTVAPALGGLITDSFGWRAVFLLPVPFSAMLLAVISSRMPGEWRHERYSPFDWTGAIIFASWSVALVVGLTGLPAWPGVLALLLSLCLFALFIWQQSHHGEPLIRVQLFRENRVFSFSLATAWLMYASTYSLTFLLSLYLQYVRGLTALEAGQVILVQAIAMAMLAPVAGRLSDSVQPRILCTLGCLCCAAGFALLSRVDFDTPTSYIVTSQFIMGIGFGLFSTPNNNAVMSAVHSRDIGVASATVNLARVSGNLVGISLVNLLVQQLLGDRAIEADHYPALLTTVNVAMTFSLGLALVASVVSASRGRPATH